MISNPIDGGSNEKRKTPDTPFNETNKKQCLEDAHNLKTYCKAKKSIKEIFNTDNLCLIKAVIIAIAYKELDPSRFDMLKRVTHRKLVKKVNEVQQTLNIGDRKC